jgi:probable F420-dependent oxidoreductase
LYYGVSSFPTEFSIQPDDLARCAEERGFESLWVSEHTHIPASRRTPWPGGPDLPKEYWHTYDPFLALTAAAMVTTSLKLGTGVCLPVEHDPIALAKAVATLDRISDGRFLFGIGGGWNVEEAENHGVPFRLRWRVLRERVLAMKAIWTNEEAEYHGRYVNFDPVWCHPKPVQRPHPPVLLGGDGPTTHDRVIEYCDGWFPIPGRALGGVPFVDRIAALRRRAKELGRDPDTISISAFWARPDPEFLSQLADVGVERVIFQLPTREREEIIPLLDRLAALIR